MEPLAEAHNSVLIDAFPAFISLLYGFYNHKAIKIHVVVKSKCEWIEIARLCTFAIALWIIVSQD